jgi:hypothetical protein
MIAINLTQEQYDFVVAAVQEKVERLLTNLKNPLPARNRLRKIRVPAGFHLSPQQVQAMKDAGIWDDEDKRYRAIKALIREYKKPKPLPKNSRLVKSLKRGPKTEEAPWGYKKDGTPRARPGRKTA